METNTNYTAVGAFVLVLITLTILAIIWLSSGFTKEEYIKYAVFMQESVTGLSPESSVEFNGVNVGSVQSIQLFKHNPHLVQLLLAIKSGTPITTGTVAILSSRGITGVTYIQLKDEGSDLKPLTLQEGQEYPVIKTAPSLLVRLDTALSHLSENLQKVSESIQSVLNEENQRSIRETLINVREITHNLAVNDQQLAQIIHNTAVASQQFAPITKLLGTQILPQSYELLTNLNNMSLHVSQVANQIKQNPSVLIRGSAPPRLGPGETP